MLIKKIDMRTQSNQKEIGTRDWKYKALAKLSMCWCFFSTMEFCCGVSTHKNWSTIPCLWKKSANISSFALSDLKALITSSNWVFTIAQTWIYYPTICTNHTLINRLSDWASTCHVWCVDFIVGRIRTYEEHVLRDHVHNLMALIIGETRRNSSNICLNSLLW